MHVLWVILHLESPSLYLYIQLSHWAFHCIIDPLSIVLCYVAESLSMLSCLSLLFLGRIFLQLNLCIYIHSEFSESTKRWYWYWLHTGPYTMKSVKSYALSTASEIMALGHWPQHAHFNLSSCSTLNYYPECGEVVQLANSKLLLAQAIDMLKPKVHGNQFKAQLNPMLCIHGRDLHTFESWPCMCCGHNSCQEEWQCVLQNEFLITVLAPYMTLYYLLSWIHVN